MADFRGPEDTVHGLMGAGEVLGPGKLGGPLVQEALGLVQAQERGYNDLLQIGKETREGDIHEGAGNAWSLEENVYLDGHPSCAPS